MYQAYNSKGGAEIVAAYDWIPGNAGIQNESWYLDNDGHLRFEWDGETDVCWDGVMTQTQQGRTVYVDENGQGVDEKDIMLINKTTGQIVQFTPEQTRNIFNDEYVEKMTIDLIRVALAVVDNRVDRGSVAQLKVLAEGLRDVMGLK